MDCLILADFVEEYWNVDDFDEIVDVANKLHEKFREKGNLVLSTIFDQNDDISGETHRATLEVPKISFVRTFIDSPLNIEKLKSILIKNNIENVFICGFPTEGVVYKIASNLLSSMIKQTLVLGQSVYLVNDGISSLDENAEEEAISDLVENGAYLVESDIVLQLV